MPDKVIQIPSPAGSIGVVIKDSTGAVAYSATQSNAPFTVTLPVGSYILYSTAGFAENGWCFDVNDCECPELQNVTVTFDSGNYSANFKFNLPDGLPCPFNIFVSTSFTSGTFVIDSLSDFPPPIGTVYTKTFTIGGSGDMFYRVYKDSGAVCIEGNVTYDCTSPTFTVAARRDGGDCFIDIESSVQGCGSLTVNYTETSATGDSGTYGVTIPGSLPDTDSHEVSPETLCGDVLYNVSVTDCCGSITYYSLNFGEAACDGPIPSSVSLRKTGADYFLDITFPDCGVDCHTFLVYGSQIGPFGSGFAGNIPFTNPTISCGEVFPFTYSLQVFPNTTPTSGLIRYNVTIQNCCCSVSHAVPEVAV